MLILRMNVELGIVRWTCDLISDLLLVIKQLNS